VGVSLSPPENDDSMFVSGRWSGRICPAKSVVVLEGADNILAAVYVLEFGG